MASAGRVVESSVNGWNAAYLDEQYAAYQRDSNSVPADMRWLFLGFELAYRHAPSGTVAPKKQTAVAAASPDTRRFYAGALSLLDAYRSQGHRGAKLDPFDRPPDRPEVLTLRHHGLNDQDLNTPIPAGDFPIPSPATLGQLVDFLERTYCGHTGVQADHVTDLDTQSWIQSYFERGSGRPELSRDDRVAILEQIIRAECLEKFIGKRYVGEKRFSGEGAESMVPLLNHLIASAGAAGVEEMVFGMAHRGRTTILNAVFGKSYEQICTEFEGLWHDAGELGIGGDVRVHRGHSGERRLPGGGSIYLVMASNPSHLEAVDPIVLGRVRGKQRLRADRERKRTVPVLMHGDAAMIGQGVVFECLNLAKLPGYTVGGTIHVVTNNMIGFTTDPRLGRSSRYCTDGALMIEAPVIHVNGGDPEAAVAAARFAVDYRQRTGQDVFIDMLCYRRHGHNEQDEASFTQPAMTRLIAQRATVATRYGQALVDRNDLSQSDIEDIARVATREIEGAQDSARRSPAPPSREPGEGLWSRVSRTHSFDPVPTGVPIEMIEEVCAALGRTPEGFTPNPKLRPILDARAALPRTRRLSYADAESIAWGTLLLEGHPIRLSGQDSGRGTFSHRHAIIRDYHTQAEYMPMNHMRRLAGPGERAGSGGPQAQFCAHDSPLSEFAVMGFDYGYSLCDPNMLVMWEAQFGDFCNGAQIIIDQFIASGDIKWHRWSGMVLLLPQGQEGMGPEHSSARPERFLQLCGNNNMQVVCPSTAAQCFHMFRRQLKQPSRTPLIVLTPKSLLRTTTSPLDDLTTGHFEHALDDPKFLSEEWNRRGVTRLLFSTGKISHDVMARRDANGRSDTAIIRIDQMYPFDAELIGGLLRQYPAATQRLWVQEECRNQGAYLFLADRFRTELGVEIGYIGRPESASVSVGPKVVFKVQQEALTDSVCGPMPEKHAAPEAQASRAPPAQAAPHHAPAPRRGRRPIS